MLRVHCGFQRRVEMRLRAWIYRIALLASLLLAAGAGEKWH